MYTSKTVGQKIVKHVNSTLESIKKYAEEQAWAFGYCDIYKNDKIIITAFKQKNSSKIKLITH